jgi:hypothetical protein
MRPLLQIVSLVALVATIAPSILFLVDRITLDQAKWIMLIATLVWFVVTPIWMGRPKMDEELVI